MNEAEYHRLIVEHPMSRVVTSLVALAAASLIAGPVAAADWSEEFRPAYPADWEMDNDTLNFDIGIRYWYALGNQSITAFGGAYELNDQSHIIEGHFRIEDEATSSYVKAFAGYAGLIDGNYSTPSAADQPIVGGGTIGYVQGDFGWMPLGDANFRIGGLVGYQYWNNSPDMGRVNFLTPTGGNSLPNRFDVNSLRLGVTSKYDFNSMFDITAELAAVPFGWVSGTFGANESALIPPGYTLASSTEVNGRLWGGQAELLFGLHPTENITVRFGGRAWYLTGPVDATYSVSENANPANTISFVGELEDFSLMRYGALAELSVRF